MHKKMLIPTAHGVGAKGNSKENHWWGARLLTHVTSVAQKKTPPIQITTMAALEDPCPRGLHQALPPQALDQRLRCCPRLGADSQAQATEITQSTETPAIWEFLKIGDPPGGSLWFPL